MGGGRTDLKIVFFGTPDYVMPVLTTLHRKFVTGPGKSPIVAIVTQSPKPVGRKQFLAYSPVDKWAHDHGIPIHYSANELAIDSVEADVGILASYGEIIKPEVIKLFPHGILVIHPSLLPKYRGASPIPAAIMNGETTTGVTIFKMDEKVDHGKVVCQFKEDISPTDDGETLRTRLFERSAEVLVETIEPYLQGKIRPKVQDESFATFTKIMTREDGHLDLTDPDPIKAEQFVRAMLPWPVAWTLVYLSADDTQSKRLKIYKSHVEDGKLVLDEVQLEGKDPVSWKQFKEGYPQATFATAL
jgi:methionyl-tRNA formyltransferase